MSGGVRTWTQICLAKCHAPFPITSHCWKCTEDKKNMHCKVIRTTSTPSHREAIWSHVSLYKDSKRNKELGKIMLCYPGWVCCFLLFYPLSMACPMQTKLAESGSNNGKEDLKAVFLATDWENSYYSYFLSTPAPNHWGLSMRNVTLTLQCLSVYKRNHVFCILEHSNLRWNLTRISICILHLLLVKRWPCYYQYHSYLY